MSARRSPTGGSTPSRPRGRTVQRSENGPQDVTRPADCYLEKAARLRGDVVRWIEGTKGLREADLTVFVEFLETVVERKRYAKWV